MTHALRAARPEDESTIVEFQIAMARETEGLVLDPQVLARGVGRALADSSKGRYLIAELEGEPVGSLLVTREWSDWRDGWIDWIQSVYLIPDARGRGVYEAMHRRVLALASADPDVRGVRLYVVEGNQRARSAYEKAGMHRTDYLLYEQTL